MPNPFFDNIERWKALADVDYFTQFMKAWLVFNAWMSTTTGETADRTMLNAIKQHENPFKNKILSFLNSTSTDGSLFRNNIGKLHQELETTYIHNKGEKISFFDAYIEQSSNSPNHSFTYRRITFTVERQRASGESGTESRVVRSNGHYIFREVQAQYDMEELLEFESYKHMSYDHQASLKSCYEYVNPRVYRNLISDNPDDIPLNENLFLTNEGETACKGLIEILYKIRCVLFHGDIVPNRDTNRIYEASYHILKQLIDTL